MPSTTSSSVSRLLASSTVMTPSLPTFFIASAIILPIDLSPLAAIEPTWATSSVPVIFLARALMSSTTASTARSMPRLRSIGFMPAATDFTPSRTIAWARTVAVVVPSPARSLVLLATSRTIWAPMFSNLSPSSISLATVTPSLVMRGAPNDLSMTTLRPFGPSVTRTALARVSTPRNMRSRASVENLTSLAAMIGCSLLLAGFLDDAHHVGFLHDDELFPVQLDFRARPFAEQDTIALLDVERVKRAVLAARAGTDGDDLAFHRLFLGGIGDDDAAGGPVGLLDAADEHTVVQWSKR